MQRKFSENENKIVKALSNVIKRERLFHEKSQRLIAMEYGIHKSMISRYESCSSEPHLFSLWKIANMFEMKLSELIILLEDELKENIYLIDE